MKSAKYKKPTQVYKGFIIYHFVFVHLNNTQNIFVKINLCNGDVSFIATPICLCFYMLLLSNMYLLYSHLFILFIIALQVYSNDTYTNSDMFTLGQVFYSLLVSSNVEQFYRSDVCRHESNVSDQPLPLAVSLRYILQQMMTDTVIHKLTAREAKQRYYSKTCVKRPLSKRPEIDFPRPVIA